MISEPPEELREASALTLHWLDRLRFEEDYQINFPVLESVFVCCEEFTVLFLI